MSIEDPITCSSYVHMAPKVEVYVVLTKHAFLIGLAVDAVVTVSVLPAVAQMLGGI